MNRKTGPRLGVDVALGPDMTGVAVSCKTLTRWEVDGAGNVVFVGSGQDCWRCVQVFSRDLPASAEQVADLLNLAFATGMQAKVEQIRNALALKG